MCAKGIIMEGYVTRTQHKNHDLSPLSSLKLLGVLRMISVGLMSSLT